MFDIITLVTQVVTREKVLYLSHACEDNSLGLEYIDGLVPDCNIFIAN